MEKMQVELTEEQIELLQSLVQNEMVNILEDITMGDGDDLQETFQELNKISKTLNNLQ